MAKDGRRTGMSLTKRITIIGAVALFLIVDVLLILLAFGAFSPKEESDSAYIEPPATFAPTPTPTATAEPEPVDPAFIPVRPLRYLAVATADTAWRALVQDCPATSTAVDLTTTGGAEWQTITAGTLPGTGDGTASGVVAAAGLIGLGVLDVSSVYAITGNPSTGCVLQVTSTIDLGSSWGSSGGDALNGAWYLQPGQNLANVHTPFGIVTAPCSVVGIAGTGVDGAIVCSEGVLHRTRDAGQTWDAGTAVPGASVVTTRPGGYVVGAAGVDGCEGLSIDSFDVTGEGETTGCFPATITAGQAAIGVGDGVLWAWVGDSLARSNDLGASWY